MPRTAPSSRRQPEPPAPRLVHVVSLGCPKNLVDTEVMCGLLATSGEFMLTDDPREASVTLINTCCFIAPARAEAEGEITQALAWKKARPSRVVVVAGCLPQRDLQRAAAAFPEVDVFLGVDDEPQLVGRLRQLFRDGPAPAPQAELAAPCWVYDGETPRLMLTAPHYAYVKIADGCDHCCLYCAIPKIRGPQRSRPLEHIVAECAQLLQGGVRELNLVAQDTTYYGADRQDGAALVPLLRRLEELPGQFWLRLLYTNPRFFPPELVEWLATSRKLLPYIDIPLQHSSTPVLKAMGRGIDGPATRALLAKLRQRVPGLALRTTFLVGYPGETQADFDELYAFVREFRFDRLGVFAYSPEEGTPAASLKAEPVPPEVAEARRQALMELQQQLSLERNRALVGQTLEVLVERSLGRGKFIGRSTADAPDIDNLVHLRGPKGSYERGFVQAVVEKAEPYDLHARIVE